MKYVIYKENGVYKTTTEENYNRRIQNAREISVWNDFESAQEIIDYVVKYYNDSKENYIIAE